MTKRTKTFQDRDDDSISSHAVWKEQQMMPKLRADIENKKRERNVLQAFYQIQRQPQ